MKILKLTGIWILVCLGFMLASGFAPVMADGDAGDALWHAINASPYTAYSIISYAVGGDFAVAEQENGDWRGLAVFSKINGAWRVDFVNGHALRYSSTYGKGVSRLVALENPARILWFYDQDGMTERFEFQGAKNASGEYAWRLKECVRMLDETGEWKLTSQDDTGLLWQTEQTPKGPDAPVIRTYEGALQDNLRTFKLESFPETEEKVPLALMAIDGERNPFLWQQAVDRALTLNIAPDDWDCTRGRTCAVFTGPGEEYLRAASGKAVLSTNGTVWLFGEENGYALVYYRVGKERLRVGYIPAEVLWHPEKVEKLNFPHTPAKVIRTCELTDDPMSSQAALCTLPEGEEVRYLSLFAVDWSPLEWAYVEAVLPEGQPVRGFIDRELIAF